MNPTAPSISDPGVERQLATAFVTDLIVCRHHILSYPESHPVVAASLEKTIEDLAPLVTGGRPFALGVSRKGMLLNNEALGPEIAKIKDFATLLASFGVITISFSADLAAGDIRLLNAIISRPRNEVWETGGIGNAFDTAGIMAIKVQVINPSVFILTDELRPNAGGSPADPWDIFVDRLLDGFLSDSREMMEQLLSGQPDELGRKFDAVLADIPEDVCQQAIGILADFFINLEKQQETHEFSDNVLNRIASFVAGISPRLRRAFILNICNSARSASGFSERLLQRLPGNSLMEAMQSVATHGDDIPEMVFQLMNRLSAQAQSTPALDAAITGPDAADKVRGLIREASIERFIPPAYQKTLMSILATDSLPASDTRYLSDMRKSLESDHLEAKIRDVIYEIIRAIPAAERSDGIKRNLLGLLSHNLAVKDFESLDQTCRMIADEASSSDSTFFLEPGLVDEILEAASLMGRKSHHYIRSLIKAVGRPFVLPLMERLFDETNRSLRRFWFDCLGDLGEAVRNAALERLNDERWYVIRNLVILLRNYPDQEVQRQVRRLVGHPHPRVRHEVLMSLLCYRDPMVDNILMQDIEGSDPVRKLAAVQLAEMSNNPELHRKLVAILDSGGIADYGLEMKSAVVQALAGNGFAPALPKLKQILFSGSFLHPGKHAKLKTEIIRALPRFPAAEARPLLEEIVASGGKNLAPLAEEILKGLQGGGP